MGKEFQFGQIGQSPVGEAAFVFIDSPTTFKNGEFLTKDVSHTDPGAKFSIALLLDPEREDHAEFLKSLDELLHKAGYEHKAAIKKGFELRSPVKDYLDEEGNPTGLKIVRFKTNATAFDGTPKSIPVLDNANPPKKYDEPPKICSGSKVAIAFNSNSYKMGSAKLVGISLYLVAVQLHELVSKSTPYGFFASSASDDREGTVY